LRQCIACQGDLSDGERTLPWEDGDNPRAYIKCPACGEENILDGFGEDD